MPITEEIFAAFLKCETKAYLKYSSTLGAQSELSQWRQHQQKEYREACRKLLCSALHAPPFVGTPDLQTLKGQRFDLILDYIVAHGDIHACLDALALSRGKRAKLDCPYTPIRFVPSERLSTDDKLMLAFDAVALSKVYGRTPRAGRIIHGRNQTVATVALFPLLGRIQRVLRAVNDQQTKAVQPTLVLNKHCAECEFQSRCRQVAMQKDDLSLLTSLSPRSGKGRTKKEFSQCSNSPTRSGLRDVRHLRPQSITPH